MIEQRTVIDHKLVSVIIHNGHLKKRVKKKIDPVEVNGLYFAIIPNFSGAPIKVKKNSKIKVVYFNKPN